MPLLGKAHGSKYWGKTFYMPTSFTSKISPHKMILFLLNLLRKRDIKGKSGALSNLENASLNNNLLLEAG